MTRRLVAVLGTTLAAALWFAAEAGAHPLGNFTTNTSLTVRFEADATRVEYLVDFAELPALRITQSLVGGTGGDELNGWADRECRNLQDGLSVTSQGVREVAAFTAASATVEPGQAGLSTIRLQCSGGFNVRPPLGATVVVADDNYADRVGWREMVVPGAGSMSQTGALAVSPTNGLRTYDEGAPPLRVVRSDVTLRGYTTVQGADSTTLEDNRPIATVRSSDTWSSRFESLLVDRALTPGFVLGALFIALVLGAGHAMAPGHGKSIMAAYVIGRRGGRRDLVIIGTTVALTHTIGVLLFSGLALFSDRFAPARTIRFSGVVAGFCVMAVGVNLARRRITGRSDRTSTTSQGDHHHDHHHDHGHDHDHDHDHGHAHDHGHDHDHDHHHHGRQGHGVRGRRRGRRKGTLRALVYRGESSGLDSSRWVVTSHAHGGRSHTHVLPQPGADVPRRELAVMGIAGGLVPSPSALLVLLASVALDRIGFGLALISAYGVGLALTLIVAGLAMAHLEETVRRVSMRTSGGAIAAAVSVLPLVSAVGLICGGALFVVRALQI